MTAIKKINGGSVRSQISYNPRTGVFTCKVSKRGRVRRGDIAGAVGKHGYIRIKIDQVAYAAHRLAWFMYYGVDPSREIDHKDGNPSNNRIGNLREATRRQNCQNVRAKGVRYEPDRKRWVARICIDYRQIYIGRFKTEKEARIAYLAASKSHRGSFARVAS